MLGTTLSHYRILGELGQGGMGQVFVAEDTRLGRKVAIKVLPEQHVGDWQLHKRLEQEAKAVASLSHPNIVTLHSIEQHEGIRFLTMELVAGETLSDAIPPQGMPLSRILDIGFELADALAAAHEQGIIHRDLKPANVMLDPNGRVKILDFGLAKLVDSSSEVWTGSLSGDDQSTAPLTVAGKLYGTLPYMSPEQVRGEPVDERTDIFSLGVLLYELSTGRRPFQGKSQSDVLSSILRDTPPDLSQSNPALPLRLKQILERCLEKDLDRRYARARDVREDLRGLRRELDSGLLSGVVSQVAHGDARAQRKPWRIAAWTAAGIVTAGAIGYGLWTMADPGSSETTSARSTSAEGAVAEMAAAEQTSQPSVAVLPLESLSLDSENVVFSDGLTEQLIHALSSVAGLNVPSRTSVFALRDRDLDLREMGELLGVDNVLEGSVRQSEGRLRVTARLAKVDDGFTLWTGSYDRELADVFAIQDEIAESIVEALLGTLGPEQRSLVAAVRSSSAEAYSAYLQAEGYRRRYNKEDMDRAESYYRKALEIDSQYAPAHAGQALNHVQAYRAYDHTPQRLEEAVRASRVAVVLAPDLSISQRARGYALGLSGRYDEATLAFERAIELDPNDSEAYRFWALVEMQRGNLSRAADLMERQVAMAGDDYRSRQLLPQLYRSLDRPEDERRAQEALLEAARRYLRLDPEDRLALYAEATALLAIGQRAAGLERADSIAASSQGDAEPLYNAACIYALAGETERALATLSSAIDAGFRNREWLENDSDLDSLRDQAGYHSLLERLE